MKKRVHIDSKCESLDEPSSSPDEKLNFVKEEKSVVYKNENESKRGHKHWSTSENGNLLARTTTFIHRMMIAPQQEGIFYNLVQKSNHCSN